jgi:hypothetical protein
MSARRYLRPYDGEVAGRTTLGPLFDRLPALPRPTIVT